MEKGNLAAVGFEPTLPKRLVPKTSALDHSATLPDMETQAILTGLHFTLAELVHGRSWLIPRKIYITNVCMTDSKSHRSAAIHS